MTLKNCPFVPKLLHSFIDEQGPCLLTEEAKGHSLHDVFMSPSSNAIRKVMEQVELAVSAIHASGVIHNNLHSGNILVEGDPERNPRVKIIDFSLSRKPGEIPYTSLKESHIEKEMPYLSPLLANSGKCSVATDMFSVRKKYAVAFDNWATKWTGADREIPEEEWTAHRQLVRKVLRM